MTLTTNVLSQFAIDVRDGLTHFPKSISSKYFYDAAGDKLFQGIMELDEYYLTRSEFEIFDTHKEKIRSLISPDHKKFRLVELGAGDGTKTKVLLEHFLKVHSEFTYSPIDISGDVLEHLQTSLKAELPHVNVEPIQGDYFKALKELSYAHDCKEVVLFLGSNIGNFKKDSGIAFLKHIGDYLEAGDILLTGFDLMKDPAKILAAYGDRKGITRDFNLNLLKRMNDELGANFDLSTFQHFPTYDPITGETKSHLISTVDQEVYFEALDQTFHFNEWEAIHTEVSQKYSYKMIEEFAEKSGFRILENLTDSEGNFVDSVWEKI